MVLRKSGYKNMDKFQKTRNSQRKRYYQKTQGYEPRTWTNQEIETILNSEMPDRNLSDILCRSVSSIQNMRCKLKKEDLYDKARLQ